MDRTAEPMNCSSIEIFTLTIDNLEKITILKDNNDFSFKQIIRITLYVYFDLDDRVLLEVFEIAQLWDSI